MEFETFARCYFSDKHYKKQKITKVSCSISIINRNDDNLLLKIHFASASPLADTNGDFFIGTHYKFTRDFKKIRVHLRDVQTDKIVYKLLFPEEDLRTKFIGSLKNKDWPNLNVENEKRAKNGSIFSKLFQFKSVSSTHFVKPEHWDHTLVMNWLKTVRLAEDETIFDRYETNFEGVTGAVLMKAADDKDHFGIRKRFFITDEDTCKIIHDAISKLKQNGESYFHINAAREKFKFTAEDSTTSHVLSVVGLNSDELADKAFMLKRLREMNKLKETVEENTELVVDPKQAAQLVMETNKLNSSLKKGDILRFRLVITEIAAESQMRMKKFQAGLLNLLPVSFEYGMFHTALIIGNSYIEWTNANVSVPRRISSQNAVFVTDLNPFMSRQVTSTVTTWEKIAEVIAHWNANFTYHNLNRNCQHFVEAIFEALNIQLTFTGPFKDYLATIKKKGESKMIYKLNSKIKEALHYEESEIEFKTHKELDEFVILVKEKFPSFASDYAEDFALLKGYDRALWLKYVKADKEGASQEVMEKLQPSAKGTKMYCPFGDPRINQSFV